MPLEISLNSTRVGELVRTRDSGTEFRFDKSYLEASEPPVLGQWFLDRRDIVVSGSSSRLPTFFRNLLPDPDGRHRAGVARRLGIKVHQEFLMLARLGNDLSGAIRVRNDGEEIGIPQSEANEADETGLLAGTQPKFSAIAIGGTYRFLAAGRAGNTIFKPPQADLEGLPENEYSMMRWAAASGINAAEVSLVPLNSLTDLPDEFVGCSDNALVVKRFDRTSTDRRIHIEDMAQVWNIDPDQKYEQKQYLSIARLLIALEDLDGFHEMIRRLAFMAGCGNSDGHLKNWSLIYPDDRRPLLAPAYDLVSVIQYPGVYSSGLALSIRGVREYGQISEGLFQRFAKKLDQSPDAVARIARLTAERMKDEWSRIRDDLPMLASQKARVEEHWKQIPLFRSLAKLRY